MAFYRAVLGWQTEDPKPPGTSSAATPGPGPVPGVDVVHFFSQGRLHGAFVKLSDDSNLAAVADPSNPHKMPVLAYFMVESIDKALAEVESAGGRVHM